MRLGPAEQILAADCAPGEVDVLAPARGRATTEACSVSGRLGAPSLRSGEGQDQTFSVRAGLGVRWIALHPLDSSFSSSFISPLVAIAALTERIRIGTVERLLPKPHHHLVVPQRRPVTPLIYPTVLPTDALFAIVVMCVLRCFLLGGLG